MITDYTKYTYKGITQNREDEIIGYVLMESGYVKENGSIIEPKSIYCALNREPLKNYYKIHKINNECFIAPIIYSKRGNYLGDDKDYLYYEELCPECFSSLKILWNGVKCSKCNYWKCY